MSDIELCIQRLQNILDQYDKNEVAVCGNIDIISGLIEKGNQKIKYIVNDSMKGRIVAQHYVLDFDDLYDLKIKYLIMADDMHETFESYKKIRRECRYNNITVLNIFGNDIEKCYYNTKLQKVGYCNVTENSINEKINNSDVVVFDIGNTLLMEKNIYYSDFFRTVTKRVIDSGINIFDLMQSIENIKKRDSFSNLRVILEVFLNEKNYPMEYLEKIWTIVIDEAKAAFIPREEVKKALFYAKKQGKKICLLEDMPQYRLPGLVWKLILDNYGITDFDEIICSGDYWLHKNQGLYEKVFEKFGSEKKYLVVGDDLETDIYIPYNYGQDAVYIESPMSLMQQFDELVMEQLENSVVRDLFERYLIKVYCNSYTLPKLSENVKSEMARNMRKEIREQIEYWKNNNNIECEPINYKPVIIENDESLCPSIVFDEWDSPKVSIIIPVYNQFLYTYNCLQAIKNNSGDVKYEVIIGDDCSTDKVKNLEDIISGIKVVHNTENKKFLLNCNNAAKYARGKYILFLNNDTQVQPNWLEPLVKIMDADSMVGMVGSKLVYPNGQLQEAGGILWKDGSAWNYGHLSNPELSEYCYVKETDYVSGAAIMIRNSLWQEIGGFDEKFAPAYYEDTDLAFEVRKHGYKVCMQPLSIVVHFEGISNGTDLSSGLKSYQQKNQKTFYDKWRQILNKEHFYNGENVYLAKDRAQTKKRILVVDHYVPNYDKDAGGRCTYMYLKMFLKLGLKVTFIGDNFAKPEPYTTELQQIGIEVIYGDFYYVHWQEWLKINLKYFDFVYLQRPHISIKYMDIVKQYSNAKVFYFAHDLHYIRTYRDYLVTGDKEALEQSEHWKPIELELFSKADVGHVVGSYEQGIIKEEFPDKPIRNIPLYIYDDEPSDIEKDFSKRRDILFVGGFNHAPNVDAVEWFGKNIFPELLQKYPDLIWHIVGSNAPDSVKALSSKNVVLEGFVTDEDLGKLYRQCRMVVVPLRYGAGVKGKIVEAAYYQIPVVTTSIGGEGIDETVGSFVMEDDAVKLGALVAELYEDFDKLKKMSDAGKQLIERYFTSSAAQQVLMADMQIDG